MFMGLSDLRKVADVLRSRGAAAAVHEVRRSLIFRLSTAEGRWFDRSYSVETNDRALLSSLTIRSATPIEGNPPYVPSLGLLARCAIRALPCDLAPFVFVDIGSGKARIVLTVARYGFRRVVGVEFAEELHRTAEENIARFRGPVQAGEVSSEFVDAREFVFPADPVVVYLFGRDRTWAELLDTVFTNIGESYLRAPRPIYLIAIDLDTAHIVAQHPIFQRLRGGRTGLLARAALRPFGLVEILTTAEGQAA